MSETPEIQHDPPIDGGFWDSVREALRGSHRDYTEGSVARAILVLAVPMVLEMIMESVFAICDVFFVSKLGASAVATVGLTESWLTLVYAIATINILLGPCLIFGLGPFPRLGATGAAVATTIGRGTGALFAFSRLIKPGSRIDIHTRHLRFDGALIARLMRLAWSAVIQMLIGMGSWIELIRILSTFGSNVLAGYTIGIRVIMFALLPAAGLANAAATMVGQALGARKPDRAEHAVRMAGTYNMVALSCVGAALAIFAPFIAGLFTQDPAIVPFATDALRIVACGFPFYAWGMVISNSFNGAGDTRTPTLLNFIVFWCWEIPLGYVLAIRMGMGPRGVYLAIAIAFSTYAVIAAVLFRRGSWKKGRV
jgi:Na+-driven multidrug efflux pump